MAKKIIAILVSVSYEFSKSIILALSVPTTEQSQRMGQVGL